MKKAILTMLSLGVLFANAQKLTQSAPREIERHEPYQIPLKGQASEEIGTSKASPTIMSVIEDQTASTQKSIAPTFEQMIQDFYQRHEISPSEPKPRPESVATSMKSESKIQPAVKKDVAEEYQEMEELYQQKIQTHEQNVKEQAAAIAGFRASEGQGFSPVIREEKKVDHPPVDYSKLSNSDANTRLSLQERAKEERIAAIRAQQWEQPSYMLAEGDSVSHEDSLALVALYNALDGDFWYNNSGWKTGPVSTWYGVDLTPYSYQINDTTFGNVYHVTGLNLSDNNLSGILPGELCNLDSMRYLHMGYNMISGAIPDSIGNLSKVTTFDLGGNFIDFLPSSIGMMSEMTGFFLWNRQYDDFGNYLSDGIYDLPVDFWGLSQLRNIELGGNSLSEISFEIQNFDSLQTLQLWDNNLTSIPAEVGSLTILEVLGLNNNQISFLPGEIGQLAKLRYLELGYNQLSELPFEIGNLTELIELNISGNPLFGLPDLSAFTKLESLYLWDCGLSVDFSALLVSDSLRRIDCWNNNITGTLTGIGNLLNLETFNVGDNFLEGAIPAELANCQNLNYLGLENNQFTSIDPSVFELPMLNSLNISNNQLSGELSVGTGSSSLAWLLAHDNFFTSISSNIGNLPMLEHFNAGNNQFEGPIPQELGNNLMLREIHLYGNAFTGNIPESFGQLEMLQSLGVGSNLLSGTLPDTLANLIDLQSIYLDNNQFEGDIPASYANLTQLRFIGIEFNNFTGLPDWSGLYQLESFRAYENALDFADLEPLMQTPAYDFQVDPQRPIGGGFIQTTLGESVTLDPGIGGVANNYQWFRNGEYLEGANNPTFVIESVDIDSAGTYWCEVWNDSVSSVTGLYLYSGNFDVWFSAPVSLQDSLALVEIYEATNGHGWSDANNWLVAPVVMWEGVHLKDSRVYKLDLYNKNLVGGIPPAIGALDGLEWLSLWNNPGIGYLPGEVYGLPKLHYMDLDNMGLERLSPAIGQMAALDSIYLGRNPFSGRIPKELFNATKLRALGLYSSNFQGTVPEEIGQLEDLRILWLSNNPNLTGNLPVAMSTLDSLEYINIGSTAFTGGLENLPTTSLNTFYAYGSSMDLSSLPLNDKLERLNIGANVNYQGEVPAFVWQYPNLKTLSLNNLGLTQIPVEIAGLDSLEVLHMGFNEISTIANLPSTLVHLHLGGNQLSGALPALPESVERVYVYDNELTDISSLLALPNLFIVSAGDNLLDFTDLGPFYNLMQQGALNLQVWGMKSFGMGGLQTAAVGDTVTITMEVALDSASYIDWYVNGSWVDSVFTNQLVLPNVTNPESDAYIEAYVNHDVMTNAFGFTLILNPINFQVVEAVSSADSTALYGFYQALQADPDSYLPQGWGEGPVESWEGVFAYGGRIIGLDYHGPTNVPLPAAALSQLSDLEFLNLPNAGFTGELDPSLFNLTSLYSLYLYGNQLEGQIDASIANLINLVDLDLSYNKFYGDLPASFGDLSGLSSLSIHGNQFTGSIPQGFVNNNFGWLNISRNRFDDLPDSIVNAIQFSGVDLTYNRFTFDELLNTLGNQLQNNQGYGLQSPTRSLTWTGDANIGGTVTLHAERLHPDDEFYWFKKDKYSQQFNPFFFEIDYTGLDSMLTIQINEDFDQTSYLVSVRNPNYRFGDQEFLSNHAVVTPHQYRFATRQESAQIPLGTSGSMTGAVGMPDLPPNNWEWWATENWWRNGSEPSLDTLKLFYDNDPIPVNYVRLHSANELNVRQMILRGAGGEEVSFFLGREIYYYDNEITFPKTSFAVTEVQFEVTTGSVDAVEIGDTGTGVKPPVLSDEYTAINENGLYIEVINPSLADYIRIERSLDGQNFNVIDSIYYRGWYFDEVQPGAYYYRAQAVYASQEITSAYSNVLKTGNCVPTFPEDKIWAGFSEGIYQGDTLSGVRDTVIIAPVDWGEYGRYFISDVTAGWYDNLFFHEEGAEFVQKCDSFYTHPHHNYVNRFSMEYVSDTLYIEWHDDSNVISGLSKYYVIGDQEGGFAQSRPEAPEELVVELQSSKNIQLSWEGKSMLESYFIQRSVSTGTTFTTIDTVGQGTFFYHDTNTLDGQDYYYRVVASNSKGVSYPSIDASLKHQAPLFEPVVNEVTTDITRTSYGGAWGDFDRDGDDDLYVSNAFELAANFLYENNGDGTFTKVKGTVATTEIGFTRTAVWGDYDNDGFLDLYVPGSRDYGDRVYRNTGSRSFEITNTIVSDTRHEWSPSEAGVWVDIENDGDLDLATSNGFVFTNDGSGALSLGDTLETPLGPLSAHENYFWTISNQDVNNDGYQDLYITSNAENMLFINDGAGGFMYESNVISNPEIGSRGYTWGDFNNDGLVDLISGDRWNETLGLYVNLGNLDFGFIPVSDLIMLSDLTDDNGDGSGSDIFFGRGVTTLDYDNDGWLDIIWTIEDRAYLGLNQGNLRFLPIMEDEQAFPVTNRFSHISVADINNDGFQDVFLPNQRFDGHNYVYLNNGNSNNWITVKLKGIESNSYGVGARVWIKANGSWQNQSVVTQNGISSGNSLHAEFGLGIATQVDSITVEWPSGLKTHAVAVAANQQYTVVEVPEASGPTVNELDSAVLAILYDSLDGANWERQQGWKVESPLTWDGTVFNKDGRLVSLILNDNGLKGQIPDTITSLSALKILDLSGNELIGTLPAAMGDMTELVNISMNDNMLEGTIPASVGTLAKLENLDLFNNNFQGELPRTFSGLTALRQFEIQNNGFIGFVPAEIGTLTNLQLLRLDHNDFEGPLPAGIGGMESLRILALNDNHFSETLPGELSQLSELLELHVQNNEFSGTLPAALSSLTGIEYIDLSNNQIEGSLAPLAKLDTIRYLNVDHNNLVDLADLFDNSADTIYARHNSFDFGDFERNDYLISTGRLLVSPQDSLFMRIDSLHEVGQFIEIVRSVDGAFNSYSWTLNGEPADSVDGLDIFEDIVTISNPDTPQQGEYVLTVTNSNYPEMKLVTRPFNLKLSSLERDKQALLEFIAAVDTRAVKYAPSGWSEENELTSDWEGVTVANDRVTDLVLPAVIDTDLSDGDQSRILDGKVPLSFVDLSGLETLDLKDNFLRSFPNISNWPSVNSVDISNNRLAFRDIVPNVGLGDALTYAPQRRYDVTISDTTAAGQDYVVSINMSGSGLQYQWKFGQYIPGQLFNNNVVDIPNANSRRYFIENIDYAKMGTYRVEITHPQVPGLTITSRNRNIWADTDIAGTVFADGSGTLLTDGEVILYRKTPEGPYVPEDTTLLDGAGFYSFQGVVLGDFIAQTRPDRSVFPNTIPTYYEKAEFYDSATTLEVRSKIEGIDIEMIFYVEPEPEPTGADFEGSVETTITDTLVDEESRINARRKVKRAGCSMRRFVRRGRTDQEEGTYELYAYVESDDEGKFNFTDIEEGTYRLYIEYPGVPMDTTSAVEFVVGGDRENQLFQISAVITEEGIQVQSEEVLYSLKPYIKNVVLYPNPTVDVMYADFLVYRKLQDLKMDVLDARGVKLFEVPLNHQQGQQQAKIDLTNHTTGVYFLVFTDEAGTFRHQIKVSKE